MLTMAGACAQVWLGYQQSLRPVQGTLSLNVDLAATAFLEVHCLTFVIIPLLQHRSIHARAPCWLRLHLHWSVSSGPLHKMYWGSTALDCSIYST